MDVRLRKTAKAKLDRMEPLASQAIYFYLIEIGDDRVRIPNSGWYCIPAKRHAIAVGKFDIDSDPGTVWCVDLRQRRD